MERSDHGRLVDAGWAYRTNADRDPDTGLWHPREEAIQILESRLQPA